MRNIFKNYCVEELEGLANFPWKSVTGRAFIPMMGVVIAEFLTMLGQKENELGITDNRPPDPDYLATDEYLYVIGGKLVDVEVFNDDISTSNNTLVWVRATIMFGGNPAGAAVLAEHFESFVKEQDPEELRVKAAKLLKHKDSDGRHLTGAVQWLYLRDS